MLHFLQESFVGCVESLYLKGLSIIQITELSIPECQHLRKCFGDLI